MGWYTQLLQGQNISVEVVLLVFALAILPANLRSPEIVQLLYMVPCYRCLGRSLAVHGQVAGEEDTVGAGHDRSLLPVEKT